MTQRVPAAKVVGQIGEKVLGKEKEETGLEAGAEAGEKEVPGTDSGIYSQGEG